VSRDYSNHQTESVQLPMGDNQHYIGPVATPMPTYPMIEPDPTQAGPGTRQGPPPLDGTSAGDISSGAPTRP
jgi:hypothetical protein